VLLQVRKIEQDLERFTADMRAEMTKSRKDFEAKMYNETEQVRTQSDILCHIYFALVITQ
jgi:hypothetical protein